MARGNRIITIKRPGVYMFYMEPQPYWEPAEDVFIIHYTKTVVTAFGDDEGWDEEIGLKTEIVPLSKPFGLYAGNVFQGIVKLDGKPVPYAEVEVEYYNKDKKAEAPTDYMVTQTIKADQNGVFTYAAPKAGWWGFAALNEADFKIKTPARTKVLKSVPSFGSILNRGNRNKNAVSVHRAPHLLCCRALEVQKYVCAPDALHLRHPVNAYN